MYDHAFSKLANHQIRHQVTRKIGYQPGDIEIASISHLEGGRGREKDRERGRQREREREITHLL